MDKEARHDPEASVNGEADRMKLLREYVRQLLSEAAKGPADLPDDVFVKFEVEDGLVNISYTDAQGKPFRAGVDKIYGTIQIVDDDEDGPCEGAWMVAWSSAAPGWGPMLYDLAMEFATRDGTGLIADREEVSYSAAKVWTHYMNKRPDVVSTQLDDLKNTLTPTDRDNCDQGVSIKQSARASLSSDQGYLVPDTDLTKQLPGQKWMRSPLSKMWSKTRGNESTTLRALKKAGKLVGDMKRRVG